MNVTFINITFINENHGDRDSGGIIFNFYSRTIMNIVNCTFVNNTDFTGGTIYVLGNLTISDSELINSTAFGTSVGFGVKEFVVKVI